MSFKKQSIFLFLNVFLAFFFTVFLNVCEDTVLIYNCFENIF